MVTVSTGKVSGFLGVIPALGITGAFLWHTTTVVLAIVRRVSFLYLIGK